MTAVAIWQIAETPGAVIDESQPSPTVTPVPGFPVVVSIGPGESPQDIGVRLEELGVIDSALQFRILVSFMGFQHMLQAGQYEFDRGTPTLEAVLRIRQGRTSPIHVVLREGLRREEIALILEREGVVSAEVFLTASETLYLYDFLADLPPGASLEGYLFPATYNFRHKMPGQEVVGAMLSAFGQNLAPELRQEALAAGLPLHAVVILASIVEREAQVPEERPIIAQAFLKRLRLGMHLEADPTVQYALAEDPANAGQYGYWKEALTEADLAVDSLYNTYLNSGLPPGPIASPGLDSIQAVIHPASTEYLYFVAKPDGSHAFAETFEEHLKNVETYQR
jgi:UPF0755 protein